MWQVPETWKVGRTVDRRRGGDVVHLRQHVGRGQIDCELDWHSAHRSQYSMNHDLEFCSVRGCKIGTVLWGMLYLFILQK